MAAAAVFSASLVAVGLYLALAAAFAFTPTWIGLGILAIASLAAIGLVAVQASSRTAEPIG